MNKIAMGFIHLIIVNDRIFQN